jgi:hypothetical protein
VAREDGKGVRAKLVGEADADGLVGTIGATLTMDLTRLRFNAQMTTMSQLMLLNDSKNQHVSKQEYRHTLASSKTERLPRTNSSYR